MVVFVLHSLLLSLLPIWSSAVPIEPSARGIVVALTHTQRSQATGARLVPGDDTQVLPANVISEPQYSESSSTLSKRVENAVEPLITKNNVAWQGEITVGTQSFNVIFDTGSSDLVLPGPNCKTCKQRGKTTYQSTGKSLNVFFELAFQDGETNLVCRGYADTVHVAGLTATNQAIAAADELTGILANEVFTADGIVGMAFPHMSRLRMPPLIQTLVQQGQLDEPIFSFLLRPGSNCYSELSLGFVNPKFHADDIKYTPVINEGHWSVQVAISVNSQILAHSLTAIIDTGSSEIYGSPDVVKAMYSLIPNSNANAPRLYPDSTSSFEINPNTFVRRVDKNRCYGGILAAENLETGWVIGSSFLQDVYTVFDATPGKARVGFSAVPKEMQCAQR